LHDRRLALESPSRNRVPTALIVLLQVAVSAPTHPPASAVTGTVRDATAGQPLAGVTVLEAERVATVSQADGDYRIGGLAAGSHQLRFVRPGYDTLTVGVLVPDSTTSRVDVELVARPVQLATLQVTADPMPPADNAVKAELGRTRLEDDWLDRQQAGDGDVYRALADAPGVQLRGDRGAGLHIRGGTSGGNLVLLDGLPVYSAVHFAGSVSAVNPDAVAGADLHAGVSSARFGDHLAGVVELESRDAGPAPLSGRGAVASGEIRQSVAGYLPGLQTGISLAARTTYRDALMGNGYGSDGDGGNGYHDLLGVATTRAAGGRLRVLGFLSENHLSFPAFGEATGGADSYGAARNTVDWTSFSQGVTWSRTDSRVKLESAAWLAGSSADIAWRGAEGPARLHNRLAEIGLSGRAVWPAETGGASAGFSLVRPSTNYAAAGWGDLTLAAAPIVGSVFVEREWRPSRPVVVTAGARASTDFADWSALEPRLTAVFEPDRRTRFGVGAGRSHQVVQSVVNDESALGLVLGLELPVAAGAGQVPVARADQVELFAGRELGSGLDLSVTAYLRRTDGEVLGAASTRDYFPGDSLTFGRGEASGVVGSLGLTRGPVSGRAALSVGHDIRRTAGSSYHTGYGNGTSLAIDGSYQFLGDTRVQLRFRGGVRQPVSVVEPGFEYQSVEESGELAGTPINLPGQINSAQLPGYARLDLGLRRDWPVPALGRRTSLTTAFSVSNVLDRTNVLGLIARPDGGMRAIRGSGRELRLEVGWRF
jgi:hypothetical protein